jgi:FlaA1/EpsC-like NDP-sugar epimerase
MNLEKPMLNAKLGNPAANAPREDLPGRPQGDLDRNLLRGHIQGRVVMVTGAAGSIGSELCRKIASLRPQAILGFDKAEAALAQLRIELAQEFPDLVFLPEIGSITRLDDVTRAIEQHRPSIVFHAAAYKHVPMLETSMFAAVENNVLGTWHVAQAAASRGVESFVLISTDKAVCPASIMGATKRVAELAIRALNKQPGTTFVAVRLGNVWGSSGSVVPIFKRQIAAGGPVTVTHVEMKRYFMNAFEAGELVLQALVLGKGGEIFVLDMGEPLSIVALARNLILLSGLKPDQDIKIEFTGPRPGEKLVEELHRHDERPVPTSHSKIYNLLQSDEVDETQITAWLEEIKEAVSERDALRIIQLLKGMIPDYIPSPQLLQHAISLHKNRGITEAVEETITQGIEPMLCVSK